MIISSCTCVKQNLRRPRRFGSYSHMQERPMGELYIRIFDPVASLEIAHYVALTRLGAFSFNQLRKEAHMFSHRCAVQDA
jgi:hypothetical protein